MKKIFKGLAIAVASTALCAGIATATACSGGYNGTYEGDYHYVNNYGVTYGMKVKVTVENNIITKVEDVTNGAYVTVSEGWVNKYVADYNAASEEDKNNEYKFAVKPIVNDWGVQNVEQIEAIAPDYYGWTNANEETWNTDEAWLLQKYEGMAVSDVLAIKVYIKTTGEPYSSDKNDFGELIITGSTQGSGRLLLAVQDALSNK